MEKQCTIRGESQRFFDQLAWRHADYKKMKLLVFWIAFFVLTVFILLTPFHS